MGVGAHADHAYSSGLVGAAEWRREAGAACAEACFRSKAGIETGRSGHKGRDAVRSGVLRDGQGAIVLHEFFGAAFKNDAVVIDAIAAANNCSARAEGIIGETDARAEVLLVGRFLEVYDVCHPGAWDGGDGGQVGAGIVGAGGAGEVGVVLPTQAEVESQLGKDAPVVLGIERKVAVEDCWDRDRSDGRTALDPDCLGNIEIVDFAVSVQIGKAEVRGEDDGAGAEDVDLSMCGVVLKLTAKPEGVFPQGPGICVSELVPIQIGGLWEIEVGSVCEVWKDEFVGQVQRRIRRGRIGGVRRNVVVEVVVVEGKVVDACGRQDGCEASDDRVEAVERVLPLRCGEGGCGLGGRGFPRVRGTIEGVAHHEAILCAELLVVSR